MYKLLGTCSLCTVEPLNNVTFGTSYSVRYREVSFLFDGNKRVSTIGSDVLGQVILFIIERFPLFRVSFNGVSTLIVMCCACIVCWPVSNILSSL